MIDLGNDVVAYVNSEENHPVELARGPSDVVVLHKDDLIFQIRENKPRHGIAHVVERQCTYVSKMGALHACRLTKCRC